MVAEEETVKPQGVKVWELRSSQKTLVEEAQENHPRLTDVAGLKPGLRGVSGTLSPNTEASRTL